MTKHHPSEYILVEFAAGAITSHLALCISMHLQYCAKCREKISRMQTLGSMLMEDLPGEAVKESLFDDILDRIQREDSVRKAPVSGPLDLLKFWLPNGLNGLRWRRQWFKLADFALDKPENSSWRLVLSKIAAGGRAPLHSHPGQEVIVVLQGGFSDAEGVYDEGDFVICDANLQHRPQAFQNGDCICLTYLEAPIRLTGPIGRWIEKFRDLYTHHRPAMT